MNERDHRLVWFELPADDVERAVAFYRELFGWKVRELPELPGYYHIETGGPEGAPDGGLLRRRDPQQRGPLNYISVPEAAAAAEQVVKLGGRIVTPVTAIPGMGIFAVCEDPEGNAFAVWQRTPKAE